MLISAWRKAAGISSAMVTDCGIVNSQRYLSEEDRENVKKGEGVVVFERAKTRRQHVPVVQHVNRRQAGASYVTHFSHTQGCKWVSLNSGQA